MGYLLLKRGLYWRPDAAGYTGAKAEAGRYEWADAQARCHDDGEPVTMVAEEDAAEFSPRCPDDAKVRVLRRERDALMRALVALNPTA